MARLTSLTHPLRIDAVALPGGGAIGLTFCPGKQQANSISGHWARDLDLDLRTIADWGAAAVVTLMEPDELAGVGVADLGAAVEARGLDWYHLPIRDVHAPGQRFENRWILYGPRLRRLLRAGRRVLIHCRGGLGRTGTVAARLLAELGQSPDAAIRAVRAARPGAIETGAQEAHVRAARPSPLDDAFLDRALGCVLGGAVGDGFGYAVEFQSLDQIRRQFGPEGLRAPVYQRDGRLQVSDDTQMTLFTLEGLTRAGPAARPEALLTEIRRAYLDWLDTQSGAPRPGSGVRGTLAARPALRHRRAPGNTCLAALHGGGRGTPEQPINQSKGCGAAMRVAPLGWLQGIGPTNPALSFDLAARAGALTHGHPDGWASGGLLAALIGELLAGRSLHDALDTAQAVTAAELARRGQSADLPALVARARIAARRLRNDPARAIAGLGQGWTGEEALTIALYAVLSASSFADAIQRAANHDGDSDSTASVAGQLWGAWRGVDSLPLDWVRRLDVLAECLHGVGELARQGYRAAPVAERTRRPAPEPEPVERFDLAETGAPGIDRAESDTAGTADDAADTDIDYATVDLRGFDLSEDAGRVMALICFHHQGEGALMTFTAKVWDSLTDPKEVKVGQMARDLGLSGTGKATLRKLLAAYLDAADAAVAAVEDPSEGLSVFTDAPAWTIAYLRWSEQADQALRREAKRWSRLLNGEPMDPVIAEPRPARVLAGPWLAGER